MTTVTVSEKGQVVIPADIRRQLGITPGSVVEVSAVNGKVEIALQRARVRSSPEEGFGMLTYRGAPHRLADFDVAEAMRAEAMRAEAERDCD